MFCVIVLHDMDISSLLLRFFSLSLLLSPTFFIARSFSYFLTRSFSLTITFSQSPEEGVRNMVAECLGALVSMHAELMVNELLALLTNVQDVLVKWTVASTLKYVGHTS